MTGPDQPRKVGMGLLIISLALAGGAFLVVGATLCSVPAGFVTLGLESIIAAYLLAYWRART